MNHHFPRTVKRILMTADTVGGVWTYALELARGLAAHGVETCLATMGATLDRGQWAEAEAVPGLRVFESDFKLEWMDSPWPDVRQAGSWLLKLEASLRPDIVHLNGYSHAALPWRIPAVVVGHSCVLTWWRAVKGGDPPPAWNEYRERVRRGLLAANLVAAPSRAMLDGLESVYGPLPLRRVLPNGRSAERFVPAEKQEYVFSAGRVWDEGKNLAVLDRVAGEVLWPVFVAGEDKPSESSARLARLHLLGGLTSDEIVSWFAHAAIYAHPARYEPFGLSVLEAALSGCALVLGDIPSLRENWENAALFVPPNDAAALRDALNTLIIDAPLRKRLAIKARTRGLRFMPSRMAGQYKAVYNELLRRASRKAV